MQQLLSSTRPAFVPDDVVFESFTFPFFDLNYHVNHKKLVESFLSSSDAAPARGKRGLYVHVPFCEDICTFCPFQKSVGTDERLDQYVNALIREIQLVSNTQLCQSWEIDAVYVGGGTPSVLGPERMFRLFNAIGQHFRLSHDVEVSFELEPKSATKEVLAAAAESGVTRVSFGIQTLDPKLRKMVNLTATLDQIHAAAELCTSNFTNTNVDMIVGFPGQNASSAREEMHLVADLGVGSVSLYPMDYVAVLPKLLNKIRSGHFPPPASGRERWSLFHEARAGLMENFAQQNMYCFGRPGAPKCRYMFEILYGGYFDQAIGVGLGAYSMVKGLAYVNTSDEKRYISQLMSDTPEQPVELTSPAHAYEKSFVYFPKRLRTSLSEALELGIADTILPKVDELKRHGLIRVSGEDEIELTPLGTENYAQIMVGFLSDYQRRLYERACARLGKSLNWGVGGPLDSSKAEARALGATNALKASAHV